jgi:hypothetical protein
MSRAYYVLGVYPDRSWVLTPEAPASMAECKSRVAWQGLGGFGGEQWRICSYAGADPDGQPVFKCAHVEYRPDRGPYTEEAWAKLCAGFAAAGRRA